MIATIQAWARFILSRFRALFLRDCISAEDAMKKKPKEYRARDAMTGRFITLAEAAKRKCSTVVEKRKKKPKR